MYQYFRFLFSRSSGFDRPFYQQFGFKPGKTELYRIAFAHRSAPYQDQHNERLEFLGDAVLSTILAEFLYHHFPEEDEGKLTQMRSILAKRSTLNSWAKGIGIPTFLQFDPSLKSNPQGSDTLYGNALEAMIGAIFVDKGYRFTYLYLCNQILTPLVDFNNLLKANTNYKSRLLEWAQQNGTQLDFQLEASKNTGAEPYFKVSAWLDGICWGTGAGRRKKDAEHEAARITMEKLHFLAEAY